MEDPLLGAIATVDVSTRGVEVTTLWRMFIDVSKDVGVCPVVVGELEVWEPPAVTADMALADRIDALSLLRLQRGWVFENDGADGEPGEADRECDALWPDRDGRAAPMSFILLPQVAPWAVVAQLGWDDGGTWEMPEHLAIQRHLFERFGARTAYVDGASIEMLLPHPVAEHDARDAARVRLSYGDVTTGDRELTGLSAVEHACGRDTVWGFWWD